MPNLLQALQHHDIGFLRIVASQWGIELQSKDLEEAAAELVASLLDPDLAPEVFESLSPPAASALAALAAASGRLPWASFVRQFGQIRDIGIAKRDREKPYLEPVSPAEVLFYRALLFRAFFNTDSGAKEFAYIPDDLLEGVRAWLASQVRVPDALHAAVAAEAGEPPGRGATPGEKKHVLPATDAILDDATTYLAALRSSREPPPDPRLSALLTAAQLIAEPSARSRSTGSAPASTRLRADKVKAFLEAPRLVALRMLTDAWQNSQTFNELRLLPGLLFEGEWQNQPFVTREFLMDLLRAIPAGTWWSLNAFVSGIKKSYPDFQRPAGDYDSWFIKREADAAFLRGFAYWDQVDGALVRFFITDILHWLGMAELASAEPGGPVTAFHVVPAPPADVPENGRMLVAANGRLTVSRTVPRAIRYQLSRFCEWDEPKNDDFRYHITPASLTGAREQGLKVEHLLTLLARHTEAGVPPVLIQALKRWDANGTEARAESQVILRVSRPEVLEELRKSKAARFLAEPLGPTSVVIKAGAQSKVLAALAELGLLAEDVTTQDS